MKVRFSHLSLSERCKIERWRQMKLSPDKMAHRLGWHRSTIFRELRRNHPAPALVLFWSGCSVRRPLLEGHGCFPARGRGFALRVVEGR
jgi:hypothetical protein